jgi:hypothetical protein
MLQVINRRTTKMPDRDSSVQAQSPLSQAQNAVDHAYNSISHAMSHPTEETVSDANHSLSRAERAVAQTADDPNAAAINELNAALEDEREDLQELS